MAQAGQGDRHEPPDRSLRGQTAGGGQGMEAIAGQLVGRDVCTEIASLGTFHQKVADKVAHLLSGAGDLLVSVQAIAVVLLNQLRLDHRAGWPSWPPATRTRR